MPKGVAAPTSELPKDPDERAWIEGHPRLVTHLRRERRSGLASAKKAAFIREQGHLICERCKMDPRETYGSDVGNACIEVHHVVPIAEMMPDHDTQLEEPMYLCVNCHRVPHRELHDADR